jgi:succinate dehydrogenase hydrophobic anchor subunit
VLAALLLASTYALVAAFLLRRGVDPVLATLVTMFGAVLGSGHWLARPHLFTYLGVVLLLALLEPARARRVWLVVPLFAIWANLHGGWLFGLFLLSAYAAGALLEWRAAPNAEARARWSAELRACLIMLAGATFATLLTPHGIDLVRHVVGFLADPYIATNTAEFQSPNFYEPWERTFLVSLLVLVAAFALTRERPAYPRLLVILLCIAFALLARRNIPLFAFSALPVAALHFKAAWTRLPDPRGIRANFAAAAGAAVSAPWILTGAVGLLFLGLSHGRLGGRQVISDEFSPRIFPTAIVAKARADGEQGRLFNHFVWGGYLLYAWPEQKVFIDGGTDFYGKDLVKEYQEIVQMVPGWRERLDRWNIDLLLLEPRSALAHQAARDSSWAVVACDSIGALLRRRSTLAAVAPSGADGERRLDACAPSHATVD